MAVMWGGFVGGFLIPFFFTCGCKIHLRFADAVFVMCDEMWFPGKVFIWCNRVPAAVEKFWRLSVSFIQNPLLSHQKLASRLLLIRPLKFSAAGSANFTHFRSAIFETIVNI